MALDGHVPSPSQHILAIFATSDRVFQVGMADPGPQLPHRKFRLFVRGREGVVSVPEKSDVFGISSAQYVLQSRRRCEMVVGFNQHGHVARTCVFSEFAQARGHAGLYLFARHLALVGLRFAAKNAHVRCSEGCRQINEPPRVTQFLCALLGIGDVQNGRTAYAGNPQLAGAYLSLALFDVFRSEDRMGRQIQVAFKTAQFNGRKAMSPGKIQYLFPVPAGTGQGREGEQQPGRFSCACHHWSQRDESL